MYGDLVPQRSDSLPVPRCAVAHGWLRSETYALLDRAARARRQHPDQLAAYILERVLHGAEDGGFIDI